jgi:hypothetical protein
MLQQAGGELGKEEGREDLGRRKGGGRRGEMGKEDGGGAERGSIWPG